MSNFILSAFADEISPHLDEQIATLQEHDIKYIEFRSLEGRNVLDHEAVELRTLASRLRNEGLGISAIGSPLGKISINDPFPPHMEKFRKALDFAAILGTPNIRMFSFYLPEGDDPANHRDAVLERWYAFREASQGHGMTLLHENEKGIYGDSPERCRDLMQTLDSPLIRTTFDPANFVQYGCTVFPDAFEMLRPWIAYMHIKDARLGTGEVVPAGEGDGGLRKILRALHDQEYQGFLSIEPHLNQSEPGGGAKMFAVAANALKTILAEIH